jgi:hypothetical protein
MADMPVMKTRVARVVSGQMGAQCEPFDPRKALAPGV